MPARSAERAHRHIFRLTASAISTVMLDVSAGKPFTTSFASQKILSENHPRGYYGLFRETDPKSYLTETLAVCFPVGAAFGCASHLCALNCCCTPVCPS